MPDLCPVCKEALQRAGWGPIDNAERATPASQRPRCRSWRWRPGGLHGGGVAVGSGSGVGEAC